MSSVLSMYMYFYLLRAYIQHSDFLHFWDQCMNVALFSILLCNLITWYKHFIVSRLFFTAEGFDIEMRSVFFIPSWTEGFPFTRLPLTMCASHHLSPQWIARPLIEVVSAEPFCQVKHSKKPVTRKPQCPLAPLGPCPPPPPHACSLNWPGCPVRLGKMRENLELGWSCVCLWRETFCQNQGSGFFIASFERNVWVITLGHSCGGTLHVSKCFWVCPAIR